jgi:hypothetical protein
LPRSFLHLQPPALQAGGWLRDQLYFEREKHFYNRIEPRAHVPSKGSVETFATHSDLLGKSCHTLSAHHVADRFFDGDVRGLICKASGNSPQASNLPSERSKAMVTREKVQEIESEISELESPVLDARNLALAARKLASSDDMPERPGLALDSVADILVVKLEALQEARERVWKLARAATDAAA